MNEYFIELINSSKNYSDFHNRLDSKLMNIICERDLFYQNLPLLIDKYGKNILDLLKELITYNKEYAYTKIEYILPYYLKGIINSDYLFLMRDISLPKIINYVIDNNLKFYTNYFFGYLLVLYRDKTALFENLDYFINNSIDILGLKERLISLPNMTDKVEKINKMLDNDPDKIIYGLVYPCTKLNIEDLKKEKILDAIRIIIDELVKNENISYHQIKSLGRGGFSNVIAIGDKVFKVGKKRGTFNIKNNSLFLQPLYRSEIKSINSDDILLCVEITERVDTKTVDGEDLYQIYKKLRDQGLIWTDCHTDNIGRLLKDNKVYFNGVNNVLENATGYTKNEIQTLKKGEVVIIDNDFIYTEEEFQNRCNNGKSLLENIYSIELISDYEYQYQYEKNKKI